ncbi:hypothetical protein CDAR_246161 [Caerostris darwini]|uniref:Uncharacterized protein n=1 Tax=Caerostris darwini TaxID=1538125 RepID=A0AAV4SSL6_9ARAC|nr:hypothetical protein CDAR_246161 [Caerostris darwini]
MFTDVGSSTAATSVIEDPGTTTHTPRPLLCSFPSSKGTEQCGFRGEGGGCVCSLPGIAMETSCASSFSSVQARVGGGVLMELFMQFLCTPGKWAHKVIEDGLNAHFY